MLREHILPVDRVLGYQVFPFPSQLEYCLYLNHHTTRAHSKNRLPPHTPHIFSLRSELLLLLLLLLSSFNLLNKPL